VLSAFYFQCSDAANENADLFIVKEFILLNLILTIQAQNSLNFPEYNNKFNVFMEKRLPDLMVIGDTYIW
jgi:hypothetical protein